MAEPIVEQETSDAAEEKTFIRRMREARKWTLEILGGKLREPVTGQSVQRWETGGTVTVDRLYQVAEAFGVAPADLLPGGLKLTYVEQQLLNWFRALSQHDRETVILLAKGLHEKQMAPPEQPKVA